MKTIEVRDDFDEAVEQLEDILADTVVNLSTTEDAYYQGKKDGIRIALALLLPTIPAGKHAVLGYMTSDSRYIKFTSDDEYNAVQKASLM